MQLDDAKVVVECATVDAAAPFPCAVSAVGLGERPPAIAVDLQIPTGDWIRP